MFADSLYTRSSLKVADSVLIAEIELNPAHPLYAGHFPDAPVLPGVVQLQILKEILEGHFGRKLLLKEMRTCKFLRIINPFETSGLVIEAKMKETDSLEVVASVSHADMVYLKAQLSYTFCSNT